MPRGSPRTRRVTRSRGYTYVFVLVLVALMGAGLGATGELWQTAMKRERERELLFIGEQMRLALKLYYASSPGLKRYPATLEALLEDRRYPNVRRYLRKIYVDPMTGSREWGLVRTPDGGIVGVHSLSAQPPLKRANFPASDEDFSGKAKYSEWIFRADSDAAPDALAAGDRRLQAWQPPRRNSILSPLPQAAEFLKPSRGAGGK